MFTTPSERDFVLQHLNENMRMLEYGCGSSTILLQTKVKELISIEHDQTWFNNIKSQINERVTLILKPTNKPYSGPGDGTYEQFQDYVNEGKLHGIYDVVFIDGRARVDCAEHIIDNVTENSLIFVHDYTRPEYKPVENFYKKIDQVDTMALFKKVKI